MGYHIKVSSANFRTHVSIPETLMPEGDKTHISHMTENLSE